MRNRVVKRRMHRVLWKKLSRIYAVDMAEVLGWIEYISIMGIFQCFCIVMACEQRGRVAFGGEYLILPAAILARLWIPEMIQSVSNVLEMPDEEEDDVWDMRTESLPSEMSECSGTERGSYLFGMPGRNLSGRQIL